MEDLHWTASGLRWEWLGTPELPEKNVSLGKCNCSGTKAFARSFWSTSPWKPCVSAQTELSKMRYQHLLYLLSLWTYWNFKFTKGQTNFFNANFIRCWMVVFTNGLQWVKTPVSCNRVRRAICPEPSGYEWYMDWRGLGAYLQHSKADPFQPLNYPRKEKENNSKE